MLEISKVYKPKNSRYKKLKEDLVINAKNLYDGREMVINAFKDKILPFYSGNYYDLKEEISETDSDNEEYEELYKNVLNVDNKLDPALIRKYFNKGSLLELFKYLKPSCNSVINDAKRVMIEINLSDLKKDIEKSLMKK